MQGLFRRETEPRATGHKSLVARKNQRRTSSDVSFLFMYRCNIAPVHTALSITTLVPTFAETITVGQVHPAGRRSVRRVPGDGPKCAPRPRLHLLTLFPSILYLVPLYPLNEGCRRGGPALTGKGLRARSCHFMLQSGATLCFKSQQIPHSLPAAWRGREDNSEI